MWLHKALHDCGYTKRQLNKKKWLTKHKMLSDKPHFENINICQLTTENWLLTNTFMSTNVPHHLCFFLFIFPTHIYHKQYKY